MITGFKAFDKNFKCRDFQFEIGKKYKFEGKIKICERGFHFCENALDVLAYYPPTSKFALVEGVGEIQKHNEDSKICCSELEVKQEVGLNDIIKNGVNYILEKVDFKNNKETNTGDQSAATNTGYQSAATNTGYRSVATNTGHRSVATNTGHRSAATNTGYQSAATVEGKNSIAIVTGYQSKAKGKKNCFLVIAEWNNEATEILDVKSIRVDGETIKEDVFYTLKNGCFVEVE